MTFEKKSVRLHLPSQLCLSQTMANEIRMLAETEDRALQDQIRHLLRLGLEVSRQKRKDESKRGGR
jgi:hypothetical protein